MNQASTSHVYECIGNIKLCLSELETDIGTITWKPHGVSHVINSKKGPIGPILIAVNFGCVYSFG